jgi:hypothetical protein
MKTTNLRGWRWILVASGTITLLSCAEPTDNNDHAEAELSAAIASAKSINEETELTPVRAVIPPANLSAGLPEIVKLGQSGVSEDVLLAYVEKSNHLFNPSVDEIVYLKDIGISDSVVAAMVRHGNAVDESINTPSESELAESAPSPEQNTSSTVIDPNARPYSATTEPNFSEAATNSPPPQQVNINYFENALSPYGNWVDVADYGYCWQPTVVLVNRNWRPYADRGRWVYTSCGWYWQSDYSWGWAAFHYGRWHCDSRIGWVWVPGDTWGPAWVSWRYTDQYCGWAPLPPSARYYAGTGFYFGNSYAGMNVDFGLRESCYTFIPTSRFCERTPSRYYVSGSHLTVIYKNSVVINNYIHGSNNTVINEGIGRERITRATRTPIRPVTLRELPTTASSAGKAEKLEGNSLAVFRPNVSTPTSGGSVTQRSGTASGSSRGQRSIVKTETTSTTSTLLAVSPSELAPTGVTRTIPPVTRNSSGTIRLPKPETTFTENPVHSAVRTRSSTTSSGSGNLPARSFLQGGGSVEHRELSSMENSQEPQQGVPASITRTSSPRETEVVRQVINRPEPIASPVQRSQPTVREVRENRRPQTFENSVGNAQHSSQAIPPVVTASAPIQNFSPPSREIEHASRIERSIQQSPPPSYSAPAPSVQPSAPHQETPSPRERVERSVEKNSRSERSRN